NSIICHDAKTKKEERFNLPVTETALVPFPIFFDSHHDVWMRYNKNLFRFNPVTKSFHAYKYPVSPDAEDYGFLQCISEDKNGRLWMGSLKGLLCFDVKNNSWKHYQYKQSDTTSLSTNLILSLCEDALQPEKYLWIGTKGGGLNRFDKTTEKFTCYNKKDGLPNNVVYGILTDNDGNLWMSTNRGLSRFNAQTQTFQNFDVSNGLQSNEFDRYSYCKTREGLLFFGGIKGLNYFDPAEIKPLDPPNVLITDFRLFNKTVSFKTPNSPLKKDITYTKAITLTYDQNVITFQFSAMDYRKAGNTRYRYMMKGFDKDWIYSGTNREATYTNLNSGSYTFVVQGSNTEGVWSKQSTELAITIIPPWWKTSWFLVMVAIFAISIVYSVYRYRLYQLLKLERMRNRIASDLHDEIGSSLSTISIYSKVAQEQLNKQTSDPQPLLKKISENTNEMMDAMSDIVWSINARNDRFENIINRMREHAVQLFEAKHYNLHFEFDERLNHIKFDMEKRKDF
ncbi:MAG TPA: triple tyrosine motif-containing protein, partial [Chitinophagaceae bacterium]|nr:triple tyrosine motif-containing protein [Chitinophagaceae bacterium]